MDNKENHIQAFCKNLQILEPFLTNKTTFGDHILPFVNIIKQTVPVSEILLLQVTSNQEIKETAHWHDASSFKTIDENNMDSYRNTLLHAIAKKTIVSDEELEDLFNNKNKDTSKYFTMSFIGGSETINGIVIFAKNKEDGVWSKKEKEFLSSILVVLNIVFLNKNYQDDSVTKSLMLDTIMNVMNANIYVTDIETDEILFMNQEMKESFSIENPENKVCWKVLQKGMTKRCEYCPVWILKNRKHKIGKEKPYIWEKQNSITKRVYRNYDNLIYWTDGRIVHIQQSIDITESKQLSRAANIDELTEMLNRRAGKMELQKDLMACKTSGNTTTICMYDINDLKVVNDNYGHLEGDTLLTIVANVVKECLDKSDYSFRLSGDEFLIIFRDNKKYATEKMKQIKRKLLAINQKREELYTIDFCYGLVEVLPYHDISLQEVLTEVDEKMYEQKKIFHLKKKRLELERNILQVPITDFTYDKEKLYDALVKSTDSYIYVNNIKTGIFRYPKSMVEEFDLPGEIVANAAQVWGDKVHPDDKTAFLEANQAISDGRTDYHNVEYRAKNRYGEWVWMRCRGHVERDENGEPVLFAGMISNLGRKKKVDHISGLLNKYEFEQVVKELITMRTNHTIGVMVLGVDDLKHINDLYDREFGDEVIRIISQKISTLLPQDASMFRLDGNEFGIVVSDTTKEAMKALYLVIQQVFSRQQSFNNRKFYSTFSAGCVLYPEDATTFDKIYRYVEYSLDWAKENGRNQIIFYNEEIISERSYLLGLIEHLRESVENNFKGFSLHYQMQVDAKTQIIIGAEALARFHIDGEDVSPVVFIPVLENNNLIQVVGKWVFKTAVATCSEWTKINPNFKISINLSYLQLLDPNFIDFMKETLIRYRVNPNSIVTELTEGTFVSDLEILKTSFLKIKEIGMKIAMDDFGTGYSSLGILKEAPVDIVKIDKTFVKNIHDSKFNATFIQFIVQLCHDVGIRVCLEGIETKEEYEIVYPMKIDVIQGFFFGRPQPKDTFEKQNLLLEKISEIQSYDK